MSESQFPGEGILWRGWNDETLALIQQRGLPVLLFVADPNAFAWPFLKAVSKAMPATATLRGFLHERYPALFIEADALPEALKLLGAGDRYHIAVLSPAGLTPMITIDPVHGAPTEVVAEIVRILERLDEVWRDSTRMPHRGARRTPVPSPSPPELDTSAARPAEWA